MHPISRQSRAEAWLEAAALLQGEPDEKAYNLILEVKDPCREATHDKAIEKSVDQFLRAHQAQPVITVAETIFPAAEYKTHGFDGVLKYPDSIYPHIQPLRANNWGTYALRMTRRLAVEGPPLNPLELLVKKLKRELSNPAPKRAVYELDLSLEPMELSLYDPERDHKIPRGGQCLSHISIKLGPNRELYLTAMYRYQFFVQKALGNLLGLARLQSAIAREVGISVGPLVCHATMATLEQGKGEGGTLAWVKKDNAKLLNECKAIVAAAAASPATTNCDALAA
ncbi:hypothetical protein ACG02S_02185 [Roseateles sp. DC23W]|uniref:Thymidylate synthase n=1 Tax=Pelomonas dachongensis TaxID=3299029 RepID=A0ABW7EH42_9BURK